ncbi:hypothetical protein [Streptomyces sp. NPDC026673]|uniref:hypothetical protein n=1 Tax=Streptomyces sp. NPDC026673 TaxID=3155724 RepID=UPI003400A21A
MRLHIVTTSLLLAAAGMTLSGCGSTKDTAAEGPESVKSAVSSEAPLSQVDRDKAAADAGIPPIPTGAERAALIAALQAINPDFAKDPDKSIDAARNQCAAINSNSAQVDREASQRFTYHGNEITDAQGKAINEALKRLKFCDA